MNRMERGGYAYETFHHSVTHWFERKKLQTVQETRHAVSMRPDEAMVQGVSASDVPLKPARAAAPATLA